ncbi:MAG: response regulator transcription factor [Deltaproteobacteria bacterium]|nr:response regulator transcription factor [Deltaproteobacteria bacterium]
MSRILVIDDDMELCELLADYLQPEGIAVAASHNGQHGIDSVLFDTPDMVILDVMLPEMNGFDVLRNIRAFSSVPVLMLTARGEEIDRIVGLEMGADDYLPKPFNPRELLARIRAIQRRSEAHFVEIHQQLKDEKLSIDDVLLDPGSRTVEQQGNVIDLTSVEFSLLHQLLMHAGQVVSRDELSKKVLDRELSIFDRSIDVHISSLRKKLGHEINGRERIKTVRGVGYLYAQPAS